MNNSPLTTEERFRMLYELSAIHSDDSQAQLDAVIKIATQLFNLDIGIISRVEGDVYTIVSCYHPEEALYPGQTFERGVTYCDITLTSHDLQAIHHMGECALSNHPCYRAFQLEAYIGIPLQVNGGVYGTLNFSSPAAKGQPFSEEDHRMMRIMGNWVSNLLKHREDTVALANRNHQYRMLVEKTKACLYIHDLNGVLLQVNHQLCQELGYEESELTGRNLRELVYARQTIDSYLSELASNGIAEGTFTLISKPGKVKYLSYKNVVDETTVLGYSQDITEQIITQQALAESENNLRDAQALVKLGTWTYDLFDDVITWSDEIARIAEWNPQLGAPSLSEYMVLVHPEDKSELETCVQRAIDHGEAYTNDHRITVGSKVKHVHAEGRPRYNHRGDIVQLIGTLQEVTEQVQIHQELIQAKEASEAAARVKQEFLANMSHEIRTPMNAILGFARLMLQNQLPTDQNEYMQAIYESAETLLVVINDILDFSKIEAGKLPIVPVHFDIRRQLDAVQKLFSLRVEEGSVKLNFDTDPHLPDALVGDPTRVNQILNNLVNNAVKFTKKGSVDVITRVSSLENEVYTVEISVRDTGIGIAPDKLDQVFKSFEQAEGDITRRYGGTGLGLTIVSKLVELMKGQIRVESTEGVGSVFTVTLPLKQGNTHEVTREEIMVDLAARTQLQGIRILLAEDNRNNQILATKFLSQVGCQVDVVGNGQEAVERAGKHPYDVILMDIQMPDMDGIEATQAIRQQCQVNCPIIAMTAHALKNEENKYLSLGMDEYISKPFKPDILYDKLLRVLKKDHSSTPRPGSAPEASSDHREIDVEGFIRMAEGDQTFLWEMVQAFLQNVPDYLKELRIGLTLQDWTWVKQTAHSLKSSVFFLGMPTTLNLLDQIENSDPDRIDKDAITLLCRKVTDQCHQAVEELRRCDLLEFKSNLPK